jgi:hypothetical protein
LYGIDTPILSQLGICASNISIDWEGKKSPQFFSHQEVNATPEVQALVARLNDLKSGGAAGLGALGGTTPRGCSFTIDCHQVSLSKWVSAIMRWTKVNTMPQTIPNTGLLLGLPWFTMVYRLTPLTSAL